MELAKSELLSKPAVLALNKTDLPNSEEIVEQTMHKMQRMSGKHFFMSYPNVRSN